jgi:hypothetical protein
VGGPVLHWMPAAAGKEGMLTVEFDWGKGQAVL